MEYIENYDNYILFLFFCCCCNSSNKCMWYEFIRTLRHVYVFICCGMSDFSGLKDRLNSRLGMDNIEEKQKLYGKQHWKCCWRKLNEILQQHQWQQQQQQQPHAKTWEELSMPRQFIEMKRNIGAKYDIDFNAIIGGNLWAFSDKADVVWCLVCGQWLISPRLFYFRHCETLLHQKYREKQVERKNL